MTSSAMPCHGRAGQGALGLGRASYGKHGFGRVRCGLVGHGVVRRGVAGPASAWPGRRRRHGAVQEMCTGMAPRAGANRGLLRPGMPRCPAVRLGRAWQDMEQHNAPVVVAPILFHRWSCEAVAEKASAAKGSAAKKTDNVESYVYRCDDGTIGIPGEYLKGAIAGPQGAAKYRQDPRSPRKSALDLYKAGVVPLTLVASLGKKDWDYLDQRRVTVQRAGVTRMRPAFLAGWQATFDLQVLIPEYIAPADLLEVISNAGRLVGLADYRPTYGRFQVTRFDVGLA